MGRGRFILQSACMKMLGPLDTPSLSAQVQSLIFCYLLPSAPSLANSSSLKRRERWQCCCALQYVALGTCVSGPAPGPLDSCGLTVHACPFCTITPETASSVPASGITGFGRIELVPRAFAMVTTHSSPFRAHRGVLIPATSPETGTSSLPYAQEKCLAVVSEQRLSVFLFFFLHLLELLLDAQ